jgi:DNA-binding CsgD family transcriptional regulator
VLSTRDYKGILDLIAIAHETPDRALMFSLFFERIHKLVPITSAAYAPSESQADIDFQFPGCVIFKAPIQPLFLFTEYYAPLHPYYRSVAIDGVQRYLNITTNLTDLIAPSQLRNIEYGTDFQPYAGVFYESCVMLGAQGDALGTMGLHRGRGERDFTDREKQIMNHVLPHLAHSIQLVGLTQGRCPSTDVGELVLDEDGRPLSMNAEARRILAGKAPSTIPPVNDDIRPTFFSTHTGVYRVRKVQDYPLRKQSTMFLSPMPPRQTLEPRLARFGLTRRQQEIALLAVRGFSNRDIAERLFISEQTVKDHLYDIFECLRIKRRTELLRRLLT